MAVGVIIFDSIQFLSEKKNQTENFIFFKTETGSNRPVSVRFGFLGQKPVQTGLVRFSRFWLGFSRFGLVFSGFFCLGSVRFFAYKTETEPNRPVFSKF